MNERINIDHCIVGGGIVGLFTALFLREKFPDDSICILEKKIYVGESSTSRNSGVLHSGIYYPTDSLKHSLCLEGGELWKSLEFFSEGVVKETGKYIFATEENEEDALKKIFDQGISNCVPGLRFASKRELSEISSFVNCSTAIYSPKSGLINVPVALKLLQSELEKKDVIILKDHGNFNLRRDEKEFLVGFEEFDISVSYLFNCAGLSAIETRKKLGLNNLENYYVKGSYLTTTQKVDHSVLLYPVPPANLKGLGVHSTMNWDGTIKFGPNTQEVADINYSLENEDLETMKDNVVKMFKGVDRSRLRGDYCGIRSKIKNNGKLWTDFWIVDGEGFGIPNYFEACGIESPGLTASPAIGRKLASFVSKN